METYDPGFKFQVSSLRISAGSVDDTGVSFDVHEYLERSAAWPRSVDFRVSWLRR